MRDKIDPREIELDINQLAMLARFRATLDDCAAFFKVHPTTVKAFIKRRFELSYTEFREQQLVHTKLTLTQKAIDMATKGDKTMLIFCLKNLCGWTDNPLPPEPVEIPRAVFAVVPRLEETKAK